jgi:hypothetical protein
VTGTWELLLEALGTSGPGAMALGSHRVGRLVRRRGPQWGCEAADECA